VAVSRILLEEIGVGGERVEMVTMSAGMGDRFADTATSLPKKYGNWGPTRSASDRPAAA
jgi:coenzyme F420-reducing hydrogenase delta subunit